MTFGSAAPPAVVRIISAVIVFALVVLAVLVVLATTIVGVGAGVAATADLVEAPPATLRPLFVVGTADGIVLDGLLDIAGSPIGVPTTWTLVPPSDPDLGRLVLGALQTWADEDVAVQIDLTHLRERPRSIALDHGGSHIRLGLVSS